jgi:hypothetical protein
VARFRKKSGTSKKSSRNKQATDSGRGNVAARPFFLDLFRRPLSLPRRLHCCSKVLTAASQIASTSIQLRDLLDIHPLCALKHSCHLAYALPIGAGALFVLPPSEQEPENKDQHQHAADPAANHGTAIIEASATAKKNQKNQDNQDQVHKGYRLERDRYYTANRPRCFALTRLRSPSTSLAMTPTLFMR